MAVNCLVCLVKPGTRPSGEVSFSQCDRSEKILYGGCVQEDISGSVGGLFSPTPNCQFVARKSQSLVKLLLCSEFGDRAALGSTLASRPQ